MSRRPAAKGGKPSNVPIPAIRFDDDDDGLPGASYGRRGSKFGKLFKKRRRQSRKPQGFFGWLFSLAFRLTTYYTIFCAIFTCGSGFLRFDFSKNDSRAVCRGLASVKANLIPIATPIVNDVQSRLDPHVGPYIRAAAPYAQKVYEVGKPHYERLERHGKVIYKKHVEPAQKRAIRRGKSYADPHINKARKQYTKQVQPHIDTLHRTVKPYKDIYHRDVAPYVSQAQRHGMTAAVASHSFYFRQIQPRLVVLFKRLASFWQHHLSPALRRAFRLTLQPLINKVTMSVFGWEWKPIESDFVYEPDVEETTSTSAGTIERMTEAIKEKVLPTQVSDLVDDIVPGEMPFVEETVPTSVRSFVEKASSSIASVVATEPTSNVEDLDKELDEELNHITNQLENWERGMSNLIADEVRHYEGLVRKGLESDDLATERQASIGSVRKYLRQARSAYNKLMDEAKFDRSVDDFEGWDKGLGVRVKLFAEDLESLERDVVESIKAAAASVSQTGSTAGEAIADKISQATDTASEVLDNAGDAISEQVDSYTEASSSPVGFTIVEDVKDAATAATEQIKTFATQAASVVSPEAAHGDVEDVAEPQDAPAVIEAQGSVDGDAGQLQKEHSTPTEDYAAEEPQASILSVEVIESSADVSGTYEEQAPQPAEADIREPTFSILPTKEGGSDEQVTATDDEVGEPTYSILPVEVGQPMETAAYDTQTSEEVGEPTFSILPIEVIDDKGTPAKHTGHVGHHEEL
jgi:hypothetical protein